MPGGAMSGSITTGVGGSDGAAVGGSDGAAVGGSEGAAVGGSAAATAAVASIGSSVSFTTEERRMQSGCMYTPIAWG
jgi:hypothetical protein